AMAEGVREARFDKLSAEITVDYDPTKSDETKLLATAKTTGQKAVLGEGEGSYKPGVEFGDGIDAKRINEPGEDVDILKHLAPGKVTVVDFGASWCGPCRVVAGAMRDLAASRPDLALRTVDILDWDSPVAQRYLKDSPQLPHVLVFTPKGNQFSVLSGLKIQELISDINRAAAEGAMGY
ncbi:MAG: thioredoxin family protein, partial [Myxococcota bacterium]|nr:thioredoxin family protein [Myxococcota bacterium]